MLLYCLREQTFIFINAVVFCFFYSRSLRFRFIRSFFCWWFFYVGSFFHPVGIHHTNKHPSSIPTLRARHITTDNQRHDKKKLTKNWNNELLKVKRTQTEHEIKNGPESLGENVLRWFFFSLSHSYILVLFACARSFFIYLIVDCCVLIRKRIQMHDVSGWEYARQNGKNDTKRIEKKKKENETMAAIWG